MDRYPGVPINIEIKGGVPETASDYIHVAEVLADFLNGYGRTEGIMVVSFNDAATTRFHQLAPDIDLAPGTALVAGYVLAGQQLPEGYKVFQVPKSFSGVELVTQDFVDNAHADGYGVHVWTIDDAPTMNELFDLGIDGIMSAQPMRLESVMCERGEPRPKLPEEHRWRALQPGHLDHLQRQGPGSDAGRPDRELHRRPAGRPRQQVRRLPDAQRQGQGPQARPQRLRLRLELAERGRPERATGRDEAAEEAGGTDRRMPAQRASSCCRTRGSRASVRSRSVS